ncbi:MAG: FAD-linked oxidase [Planctomycetota bacterium]|nr:MAG: FAD-linked oxidase [Planctomycetota bacterium]
MVEYTIEDIEIEKMIQASNKESLLQKATNEWKSVIAPSRIEINEISKKFTSNTIDIERKPVAVLKLKSSKEISHALQVAGQYGFHVYPISTGNNWGYGSASSVTDKAVILDLSLMNNIISFDKDSGLVTVQPGVTQQMLFDFLIEKESEYMVPVTGAGPHCSLLGNALERGYGITPKTDHFASVMNLKAVLPDGQIYTSNFIEEGCEGISKSHKWGMGPYMDGIFTQSNLGIVTEITIELEKTPENIELFCFQVKNEDNLSATVDSIQTIIKRLGSNVSGINLINGERALSMSMEYPYKELENNSRDEVIDKKMIEYSITAWTGFGAIYGTKLLSNAAKKEIKKCVKKTGNRIIFVNRKKLNICKFLRKSFFNSSEKLKNIEHKLDSFLSILEGKPTRVALPLAYWKNRSKKFNADSNNPNPAMDNCGLIWFTPLIPFTSKDIKNYSEILRSVCLKYGVEPLITITTLSDKVVDSSVPILFDKSNAAECAAAKNCYLELFETCKSHGYMPYRMGVDHMSLVTEENTGYWNFVKKLKGLMDPKSVLSPGRYCAS